MPQDGKSCTHRAFGNRLVYEVGGARRRPASLTRPANSETRRPSEDRHGPYPQPTQAQTHRHRIGHRRWAWAGCGDMHQSIHKACIPRRSYSSGPALLRLRSEMRRLGSLAFAHSRYDWKAGSARPCGCVATTAAQTAGGTTQEEKNRCITRCTHAWSHVVRRATTRVARVEKRFQNRLFSVQVTTSQKLASALKTTHSW